MKLLVKQEIKLNDGSVLPAGYEMIATTILQPVKGGTLYVYNDVTQEDTYIASCDLKKIEITPEFRSPDEEELVQKCREVLNEAAKKLVNLTK